MILPHVSLFTSLFDHSVHSAYLSLVIQTACTVLATCFFMKEDLVRDKYNFKNLMLYTLLLVQQLCHKVAALLRLQLSACFSHLSLQPRSTYAKYRSNRCYLYSNRTRSLQRNQHHILQSLDWRNHSNMPCISYESLCHTRTFAP